MDGQNQADDNRKAEQLALRRKRVSDKESELRSYFHPEALIWRDVYAQRITKYKAGELVTLCPCVTQQFLLDRLDKVFGAACWATRYEDCGRFVRCNLSFQFSEEHGWSTRSGVSHVPDNGPTSLAFAQYEALRDAAGILGIGRYLRSIQEVVKAGPDGELPTPRLTDHLQPDDCKKCGRQLAEQIWRLVNSACQANKEFNRPKMDTTLACNIFAFKYGYKVGSELFDLSSIEQRHARDIVNDVTFWISDLSKGLIESQYTPFDKMAYENAARNSQASQEKKKE